MAIILPGGFDIRNNEPADARISLADQTARLGLSVANVYEGLIVYQQDNNILYVLNDASDPSVAGNWSEVGSGSAEGTYYAEFPEGIVVTGSILTTDNITASNNIYAGTNITASNNIYVGNLVGIGTTSPVEPLTVQSTSGDILRISSIDTTTGALDTGPNIHFVAHDGSVNRSAGRIRVKKDNATSGNYDYNMQFLVRQNGVGTLTERMRIDPDGKVGIGTTNPTAGILQVNSTTANNSIIALQASSQTSRTYGLGINSNSDFVIYDNFGSTEYLVIQDTTGNVGIGTTDPAEKLQVNGNLLLSGSGDVTLHIAADTDNVTETHNPLLRLSQDGGIINFDIGINGDANQLFTGAVANAAYIWGKGSDFHIATGSAGSGNAAVTVKNNTGMVGIGKTSPFSTLEVLYKYSGTATIYIDQNESDQGLYFSGRTGTNNYSIDLTGSGTKGLRFFNRTTTTTEMILSGSKVGIGTTSPAYTLDVNGDVRADTYYYDVTSTLQSSSDKRLKTNITSLSSHTEKLLQLNPVDFEWSEEKDNQPSRRERKKLQGVNDRGLIAQEVQEIYPELISEDADGYLTVSYTGLIIPMLKTIQEQQKQIDELKKLISGE